MLLSFATGESDRDTTHLSGAKGYTHPERNGAFCASSFPRKRNFSENSGSSLNSVYGTGFDTLTLLNLQLGNIVNMLLIATIDPILRKNLQTTLTQKGDPFLLLAEGEDIIETVFRHNPSMVVLDLYLTQPSGLEILRQLREQGFAGKVVLLGGQSTQTLAPEASRLGAIQIVGRPFNANQVLGAVRVASGDLDQDPQ